MEGNKLELSGKSDTNSDLPASYKPIPETDMEASAVSRPKSLLKTKLNSPEVDGADEKMLPKDDKVAPNSNIAIYDVKITSNEKQNGDAKLDIGEVKDAFVGLTKEELMKYANDPFWVRLRWFLFITFWLLWAAMLFGAVMIIYAAPKCDPPPPKTWYEHGPFVESKHSISIDEIKLLKDKGVRGVIVDWPFEDTYGAVDEGHEFFSFIKQAKENSINVIVELEPGTSTVWFDKSINKDPQYSDYYIWRAPKSGTASDPPNNWVSPNNISSWIFSNIRNELYYAPSGKPHLNFHNPEVVDKFTDILKNVAQHGASGIRLKDASRLLVDRKFEDEPHKSNTGNFVHTEYGFYSHTKTENVDGLAPLLDKWRKIVKNTTDNGPFMIAEDLTNVESYKIGGSLVVDLPLESHIFNRNYLNAPDITKGLNHVFNSSGITWPLWKYNSTSALDIVTYLLPGAPIINENTPLNSELLEKRNEDSIMRGSFHYNSSVANNTVFAFIRVTSGNPGILVALNPTAKQVVADFPSVFPSVSEEVTVQLVSQNYNESEVALHMKHNARNFPISSDSAVVLSYVPVKP